MIRYWNNNVNNINQAIDSSQDTFEAFKWTQLVWQEMWMWIKLGKKVSLAEFEEMCKTRGFDEKMRIFLCEFLRKTWLKGW